VYTHTRTHTRTRKYTHARAHTHTHTSMEGGFVTEGMKRGNKWESPTERNQYVLFVTLNLYIIYCIELIFHNERETENMREYVRERERLNCIGNVFLPKLCRKLGGKAP
jgi:hypothetical protein